MRLRKRPKVAELTKALCALSLRLNVPFSVLIKEDQHILETYFDILEEESKEAEKARKK